MNSFPIPFQQWNDQAGFVPSGRSTSARTFSRSAGSDVRPGMNSADPVCHPVHNVGSGSGLDVYCPAHRLTTLGNAREQAIPSDESGIDQLSNWVIGREAPWFPGKSSAPIPFNGISFTKFRTTNIPSDCGTIPGAGIPQSDSGYGSLPQQSVGNPSIYGGDFDARSDSLVGPLASFQIQGSSPGNVEQHRDTWSTGTPVNQIASPQAPFACSFCSLRFKTNSELKKHRARHEKAHRCDFPGCKRQEGFGTQNDLDRHKNSVHDAGGVKFLCERGTCANKQKLWPRADNFRQHLKRVHNILVTNDDDLEPYKHLPPNTEDKDAEVLAGVGDAPALNHTFNLGGFSPASWTGLRQENHDYVTEHNGADIRDALGHLQSEMKFSNSQSPDFIRLLHSNTSQSRESDGEFTGLTQNDAHDLPEMISLDDDADHREDDPPTPEQTRPDRSDMSYVCPDALDKASVQKSTEAEPTDITDIAGTNPPTRDCGDTNGPDFDHSGKRPMSPQEAKEDIASSPQSPVEVNDLQKIVKRMMSSDAIDAKDGEGMALAVISYLRQQGTLDKVLMEQGYKRAKELIPKVKIHPASHGCSEGSKSICDQCQKSFNRPCDLKKHMKRHEKPYFCTFHDCSGQFGSKNDWKRHENSQHMHMESWKCDELAKQGSDQVCDKVCLRRETFKHHLKKDHQVQDTNLVKEKLDSCRVGRSQDRFWCGFCQVIVQATKEEPNAWAERFTHIEEHFLGRGRPPLDIHEWKPLGRGVDETAPLGLPEQPSPEDSTDSTSSADATASPKFNTQGRSHKRASDEQDSSNPNKRSKRQTSKILFWHCCECGSQMSATTDNSCTDCFPSHKRCDNCRVELHRIDRHHTDARRQSSEAPCEGFRDI